MHEFVTLCQPSKEELKDLKLTHNFGRKNQSPKNRIPNADFKRSFNINSVVDPFADEVEKTTKIKEKIQLTPEMNNKIEKISTLLERLTKDWDYIKMLRELVSISLSQRSSNQGFTSVDPFGDDVKQITEITETDSKN